MKIEGCELWTRTFPPSPLQPSPPFASHHHISTLVDEQGPRWSGTNCILTSAFSSVFPTRAYAALGILDAVNPTPCLSTSLDRCACLAGVAHAGASRLAPPPCPHRCHHSHRHHCHRREQTSMRRRHRERVVRRGIGLVIESDFYATEAGRNHFANQLTSIRYCVQETW